MEVRRKSSYVKSKMKRWQYFTHSFIVTVKCTLLKISRQFRLEHRGDSHGLGNLYKDMETCGEYTDIQVMWEILQTTSFSQDTTRGISRVYNQVGSLFNKEVRLQACSRLSV
ncbi:hypothetical protein ACFE04_002494 [Oxalis oulophora]